MTSFYGGLGGALRRSQPDNGGLPQRLLASTSHKDAGVKLEGRTRPQYGERPSALKHFLLTMYHLKRPAEGGFPDIFERRLMPKLSGHGVANMAALITEAIASTYPRLPVREGEHVHATFLRLDSAADQVGLLQLVSESAFEVLDQLTRSPEVLLTPTSRSLLR